MNTPAHYLHIFQKPKLGSSFFRCYRTFNYNHTIAAMGWFDTASCQVAMTQTEAEYAYENYLGNRVAVYVDNPAEPIWEGLVNRVTFEAGGVTFTRSLDNMFNKVKAASWSTTQAFTAATSTLASQAIYGIKEGTPEANRETGTRPTALRDVYLATQSWPQASFTIGGGANVVTLELLGFFHTLEWESIQSATANVYNPDTIIEAFTPLLANGTTFFDNTDLSEIDTNAAYTTTDYFRSGETFWEQIKRWAEPGDGVDLWIAGITPSDPTGTRRLYYREYNPTVEYTARVRDGMRIRNLYGGLVRPWTVIPDRGIRVQDVLTGWAAQGDDPRELYIQVVRYDAERQQVTVQGADDVTTEGAFQLRRYHKVHGTRFGSPPAPTTN